MKWTTMVPDVRAGSVAKNNDDATRKSRDADDAAGSDPRQSPGVISGVERLSPKLTSRSVQTEIPTDGFSLPGDLLPVYLKASISYRISNIIYLGKHCILFHYQYLEGCIMIYLISAEIIQLCSWPTAKNKTPNQPTKH